MNINNITDQLGQINHRGIHDAVVQRFVYILGERLDICLRDAVGADRWLRIRGVRRVGFKDVVEGTIVSDVFCWAMGNVNSLEGLRREAWITLLGNNFRAVDFNDLCGKIEQQYAQCRFVFIESSYGGTISAICDDVSFVDANDAE